MGELQFISEEQFKSLFETAIPILRAARGARILIVGPLARYAIHKCCEEASHVTKSEDPVFVSRIKDKLLTIGKNLKNLVHLRRIKEAKVLNPAVLMRMTSASEDALMRIWGMDPVHPTKTAYTNMAASVMDEIESDTKLNARILSSGATGHSPHTASYAGIWQPADNG